MNDKHGKNVAASVRDRLLALARERDEDFQLLLTQFGLERLLYRLSQSAYRDSFILKGAMLFVLWRGQSHRSTQAMMRGKTFTYKWEPGGPWA